MFKGLVEVVKSFLPLIKTLGEFDTVLEVTKSKGLASDNARERAVGVVLKAKVRTTPLHFSENARPRTHPHTTLTHHTHRYPPQGNLEELLGALTAVRRQMGDGNFCPARLLQVWGRAEANGFVAHCFPALATAKVKRRARGCGGC